MKVSTRNALGSHGAAMLRMPCVDNSDQLTLRGVHKAFVVALKPQTYYTNASCAVLHGNAENCWSFHPFRLRLEILALLLHAVSISSVVYVEMLGREPASHARMPGTLVMEYRKRHETNKNGVRSSSQSLQAYAYRPCQH